MYEKPIVRYLDRTTPPHLTTLVLMAGVGALSLNVFLPSLPSMAETYGVSYGLMQLSVSLYLAATAVLQILVGPVSDRYGRRPVMLWATGIFILASLGVLLAPNYTTFITCRMIQAVVASGMVLSRATVRDMVPQDQAASMIGYVTMGMALVPMAAPVLGGFLDQAFGWESTFLLMALCGLALVTLIWADMGETTTRRSTSMLAQLREYPQLLVSQRFWGYCLTSAFSSGTFFAYLGGAPYVGSTYFEMDSATLGLYFGTPAVGYMFGNYLSGRYAVRFGANRMLFWGVMLTVLALIVLVILTLVLGASPAAFFGMMVGVGIGNGLVMPSANAGMLSVRPHLAGSAAGLGGAFMIGGGAALSVLAGFILRPETGPMPLILLMLASSAIAVPCIFWVIWRQRRVGGA
ncbi:MAG: multidrug effflux MFS transporter [Pseudorhodobacter sp.]